MGEDAFVRVVSCCPLHEHECCGGYSRNFLFSSHLGPCLVEIV